MADEETYTLWDHISGEAFEGPLKGHVLHTWPMFVTTVEAEFGDHENTLVHLSTNRSLKMRVARLLAGRMDIGGRGFIPPPFYSSMASTIDPRLPKLTQGLGVIEGGKAKYYPMQSIARHERLEDQWDERTLWVERGAVDGVPRATWKDSGDMPMQLLSRWYGFSFTYPTCEIYEKEE